MEAQQPRRLPCSTVLSYWSSNPWPYDALRACLEAAVVLQQAVRGEQLPQQRRVLQRHAVSRDLHKKIKN